MHQARAQLVSEMSLYLHFYHFSKSLHGSSPGIRGSAPEVLYQAPEVLYH